VEAEQALIGLDRFDAALQLEAQAKQLGIASSGMRLAAGYLAGREDVIAEETGSFRDRLRTNRAEPPAVVAGYGLYLDNVGHPDETGWESAVATTEGVPELTSARAYLFAQSALDRALSEDCPKALAFVRTSEALPSGAASRFRVGMAAALCGERAAVERSMLALEQLRSGGAAVTRYGPLELRAALAISEKDPGRALELLSEIQSPDELSLAPYLRALAYGAQGDLEQAVVNLRAVMMHRGTVFHAGSNLYPVARSRLMGTSAALLREQTKMDVGRGFVALRGTGLPGRFAAGDPKMANR
jgi:eukaryotic-like serine/threonine-protein kinase